MIDIFVLGLPFFVWLSAFLGIHIASWIGEELSYRRRVKRSRERQAQKDRRQYGPEDEG